MRVKHYKRDKEVVVLFSTKDLSPYYCVRSKGNVELGLSLEVAMQLRDKLNKTLTKPVFRSNP